MNVGTAAAIKGGISSIDLVDLKCQVELCNTYHLHLRPTDKVVREMGGLHKFMNWKNRYLPTAAVFRYFHWQSCVRLKKKAFTLHRI